MPQCGGPVLIANGGRTRSWLVVGRAVSRDEALVVNKCVRAGEIDWATEGSGACSMVKSAREALLTAQRHRGNGMARGFRESRQQESVLNRFRPLFRSVKVPSLHNKFPPFQLFGKVMARWESWGLIWLCSMAVGGLTGYNRRQRTGDNNDNNGISASHPLPSHHSFNPIQFEI